MIVLDTNVVSELVRPAPSEQVLQWFALQPALLLYTTSVTQAEILYGVEILTKGKKKKALEAVLGAMFQEDFRGRVLAFDAASAVFFAEIAAARKALGRPISQFDAQIAAIARSRKAALATRNTADFADCGVKLHNPWDDYGR
jgi:predicted nucleic acid-binding protein